MNPTAERLRFRTRTFGIRILKFVRTLPRELSVSVVAHQLARCGTGISSNYHAACRARSRAEFIAKLGVVLEEADETEHWLAMLAEIHMAGSELDHLQAEARELRAIFKASVDTARANHRAADKRRSKSSSP